MRVLNHKVDKFLHNIFEFIFFGFRHVIDIGGQMVQSDTMLEIRKKNQF
jgi:hypothetical protein